MSILRRLRSPRLAAAAISILLAVAGVAVLGVALHAQRTAPQPSAAVAGSISDPPKRVTTVSSSSASTSATTTTPVVHALPPSAPTTLTIPSIGVHTSLVHLDQNPDGSVQVPTSFHVAGWYDRSVTPGQIGPAIFLGHVDSKAGPGIFYRLGAVHPGDRVSVARADGSTVQYEITGVREYLKTKFPTISVYGNTATPTIRLVTCGGVFDRHTGHYLSNIVAYGRVV